ncbi:hypothetical protein DPMN_027545 [Dreissena polymorpha]|uniref:Uncharacterized protein n=1 Tax=Dreissena polymorpha TaxID=45954 RepID=A0A9D4RDJ7_DREPO|nr:hypothetical protein DPMN_027545 [Dreissena polymorpha]
MRNHLAEDVLNAEMLNLLLQYQPYLGEKGNVLTGVIELLQQTSLMIRIFRDMKPIITTDESRLTDLMIVFKWFKDRETYAMNCEIVPKNIRAKKIMSIQCHEDIQSCAIGFVELCQMLISAESKVRITLTQLKTCSTNRGLRTMVLIPIPMSYSTGDL